MNDGTVDESEIPSDLSEESESELEESDEFDESDESEFDEFDKSEEIEDLEEDPVKQERKNRKREKQARRLSREAKRQRNEKKRRLLSTYNEFNYYSRPTSIQVYLSEFHECRSMPCCANSIGFRTILSGFVWWVLQTSIFKATSVIPAMLPAIARLWRR